jgi:cytochrome c oxidase cbb3-type subunit II
MMNSCSACRQDLRLDQRRISLPAVVAFLTLAVAGARSNASGAGDAASSPSARNYAYDAARGEKLYAANCSACHQASGEGVPGAFPPLKGSPVVNRDDASKHMHVVLDGLQGARVGGVVYGNAMPPFGETLGDADIADIVDYVRSSWGNHGKPVTAAQVAAERATAR